MPLLSCLVAGLLHLSVCLSGYNASFHLFKCTVPAYLHWSSLLLPSLYVHAQMPLHEACVMNFVSLLPTVTLSPLLCVLECLLLVSVPELYLLHHPAYLL